MRRRIAYGIVLWLVPFISAIPLVGVMQQDPELFHTAMIVEGSIVGAVLACVYFGKITRRYLYEGMMLGLVWLVVNWALDLAALLPIIQLTPQRYFAEIGLRYIAILPTTMAIGFVLWRRVERTATLARTTEEEADIDRAA